MSSRARNLANLLGGGEVTIPATKIADIPASKLSDEISTIEQAVDINSLTATGNTVGDQRIVGNNLYIWNGSGWFRIALINETPTWDSDGQPNSGYNLNTDSPAVPTIIALSATDPDGFPISYSYITGGSMDSIATISQDSSVFTITPKTEAQAPDGGTGTITFRASDGVNILPYVSSFTLTFISWANATQQAKIQPSGLIANDRFGNSVTISGDGNTAIVGAWFKDTTGNYSGAAYAFTRSGTTWSQQQMLQSYDIQQEDHFGWRVSISHDGNMAVVGAYNEDAGGDNAGAAYVHTRSGSSWNTGQKLIPNDAGNYDNFGWAVAISGDKSTAIVGAPSWDSPSASNAGAAYIFTDTNVGWSQQAIINASDAQSSDRFGKAISISGDGNTAIVGAPDEDTGGSNAGAVYIFTRSGSSWSQQQKIQASDAQSSDRFGTFVSISSDGDTAIVGAPGEATGGTNAGAAYIFTRSGTTWSQEAKIVSTDLQSEDKFGTSVSISGDGNTAIVGATGEDTTASEAGSAYIFTRAGTTWSQKKKFQASNASSGDSFGEAVAMSNDGETAIVGSQFEDTGGTNTGSAYIFVIG